MSSSPQSWVGRANGAGRARGGVRCGASGEETGIRAAGGGADELVAFRERPGFEGGAVVRRGPNPYMMNAETDSVVRAMGLADAVCCVVPGGPAQVLSFFPVLRQVRRRYPQASVDVVCDPSVKKWFGLTRHVRKVLPLELNGVAPPLSEFMDTLGTIKTKNYDVLLSAVCPTGFAYNAWVFTTSIPTRAGYAPANKWPENRFLTDLIVEQREDPERLRSGDYSTLMRWLGAKGDDLAAPAIEVDISDKAASWAAAQVEAAGLAGKPFVVADLVKPSISSGISKDKLWVLTGGDSDGQGPLYPLDFPQQQNSAALNPSTYGGPGVAERSAFWNGVLDGLRSDAGGAAAKALVVRCGEEADALAAGDHVVMGPKGAVKPTYMAALLSLSAGIVTTCPSTAGLAEVLGVPAHVVTFADAAADRQALARMAGR